jgi:hypothetical protein
VVAISLLLGPYVYQYSLSKQQEHKNPYQDYYYYYFHFKHYTVAICIVYGVLLVVVLLVTVSRMRFAGIINLADSVLGKEKQEFWRRVALNLCMIGAIVTAAFSFNDWYIPLVMIVVEASTLVLVSFGNFQVPAAVLRVVLPLIRFGRISDDYPCKEDDAKPSHAPSPAPASAPSGGGCNPSIINLAPSLYVFYGMVLGQGALYLVACVVEHSSLEDFSSAVGDSKVSGELTLSICTTHMPWRNAWKVMCLLQISAFATLPSII